MNISTVRMGKYLLFFALLGCCLTVTSGHITIGAEEPVFPTESSYVDVELREIFRDLAETGRFRVLFANRFQKRATMIIAAGAPVKKTTAEIAANHGLMLKWVNSTTAVIGDASSLAEMNTSDIKLHILPLQTVSPVTMAEVLEAVLPSHKIRYDFKGNNIAVMASSLELENIKELVERWDRENPVITVEVEVVEVTLDFLRELGIKNPASPQMKAYPLPEKLAAMIAEDTEKNSLARHETRNLNNREGNLFFGDRIPGVSEKQMATTTGYQIDYIDVGTTVDYRFKFIPHQEDELLLELLAKVEMVTGPSLDPVQRELRATVGLVPEQTIIITGVLKRTEYLQMKTPSYEFPFLGSLFAATNGDAQPDEVATVIFLTPSFQKNAEKTAGRQDSPQAEAGPDLEPEPLKPAVSLVPEAASEVQTVSEVPAVSLVPVVPEIPEGAGKERKDTPKANTTDIPYTVKKSETLYGIAKKFGVSVQQLTITNRLENPGEIKAGATLIIPVPNEFIYTVKTNETLWRLAKRYGTTVAVLKDLNSLAGEEIKVGQKLVLPVAAAKIANPQF